MFHPYVFSILDFIPSSLTVLPGPAFLKEHGCNKMICSSCRTMSCYICRKIIQYVLLLRSDHSLTLIHGCRGYDHFDQMPGQAKVKKSGKCPLWDDQEKRHHDEVRTSSEMYLRSKH